MEEKINIAEILKDKSEGTKLWTDMFGSVTLYVVTDACDAFQVKHHNKEPWFDKDGKLCKEGVLCIYPSKSMRDWSKFAWKKGDVLVSKDNVHIIFEKFEDDAYTRFKGRHYLWKYCDEEDYNKEETKMLTSVFEKANDDVAQTYIKTIEEKLGGKLNGETLEVDKAQQEFKNGDIVTIMPRIGDKLIYLFKAEDNEKYYGHAFLDGNIAIVNEDSYCQKDFSTARPSTEEEKQQLFSALAKKGKAWDAENKEVADLKPKVKPFDRVLVRDSKSDNWRANLFGYIGKDGYYHCVYANWAYCIPYIGNESLLGTTKDVEG
nr:MAG TPA: hypothetical protein [Caudoviricetes sp.]